MHRSARVHFSRLSPWPLAAALLLPLAAAGCNRSPAKVVEEADQSVRSWSATVDLVAAQREKRVVPDHYVRQVLKDASEDMETQNKSLAKVPADAPHRRAVEEQARELKGKLDRLASEARRPGAGRGT